MTPPLWYITFGQGDDRRKNCYTVLNAVSKTEAVELAYRTYGNGWSMAYDSEEGAAVVERWGLTYIPLGT